MHTRDFIVFNTVVDKVEIADVFKRQLGRDFFVHVVENDGLNGHHLAADHRVRQIELDEKRPEHLQL